MQPKALSTSDLDALWIGVLGALALCLSAAPDVGYGDAGELGTAAVVLGVAHPTGFALDLLWLKAASLIPLGSLAFRLNVATALTGGLALGLCAAVTGALAQRAGVHDRLPRRLGVLLASTGLYGFGTFAAATQALEVYALALGAVLLGLFVALAGGRAAAALAVLVGLAAGMHVTAGMYLAPILVGSALAAAVPWRFVGSRLPGLLSGALVLSYLPLASRRDPPADWGDPETLAGLIDHLTAQRIRSAFQAEMFGGAHSAPGLLLDQLSAFGVPLCFALIFLIHRTLRARRCEPAPRSQATPFVIGIALLGALDVAYALLVNPMGVRQLQCGHVAGACAAILGGVAAARMLQLKTQRALVLLVAVAALAQLAPIAWAQAEDGHGLHELFGSAGAVAELPPRTVFLCNSDDACAPGMFATLVERVRPDVDVVPAQHLWDATVLRRIEGFDGRAAARPSERAQRAVAHTRALMHGAARRPIAFETRSFATQGDQDGWLAPLGSSPFLSPVRSVAPNAFAPSLAALDRARRARYGAAEGGAIAMPPDERARVVWSRVYGELGSAAIDSPAFASGLAALQRAVAIAPGRASAWINLGVALEMTGQLEAAIGATARATEIEPESAAGWLNLARIERGRGNIEGARAVLARAAHAGADDPRLCELAAQLGAAR